MAGQPPHRFMDDRYRLPVERLVSERFGKKWTVKDLWDMKAFASHPAAVLSDGSRPVFVKLSEAAHGLDQFEAELAGLRLLAGRAGVLVPDPVGLLPVPGGVLLVLEAVRPVERTPERWREIGRTLARIHQVAGEGFGYEKQGYFGPLYQDNRPAPDWLTFFTERRMWPRLCGAIDSGHLPTALIRQVERLIARLPDLGIPPTQPRLLHGDAQQNNFITTEMGTMVIDPAAYYGDPEMDLATVDYFQAVPEEVFTGYQEEMPVAPGFWDRRDLWRLPGYLAAVTVEGASYLELLARAVQKYL